jgi:membrane carboxypeptidase/penicillin-binding protein
VKPNTVVSVTIDTVTGCLATEESTKKHEEYFVVGSEPAVLCDKHGGTLPSPVPMPLPVLDPVDVQKNVDGEGQ